MHSSLEMRRSLASWRVSAGRRTSSAGLGERGEELVLLSLIFPNRKHWAVFKCATHSVSPQPDTMTDWPIRGCSASWLSFTILALVVVGRWRKSSAKSER